MFLTINYLVIIFSLKLFPFLKIKMDVANLVKTNMAAK